VKFEYKLIGGAALFLTILYVSYWFTSYEDTGSVELLFGACAYVLLAGFLVLQWRRRRGHPRPEDDHEAELEDGEGEISFFPSASIWPAGIGLGAILIAIGLIWGTWYLILGFPILVGAIIGFSVEAEAGFDAQEEAEAAARGETLIHGNPDAPERAHQASRD
jgi:hypothetical protein